MIFLLQKQVKDLEEKNIEIRSRHYALELQGVVD